MERKKKKKKKETISRSVLRKFDFDNTIIRNRCTYRLGCHVSLLIRASLISLEKDGSRLEFSGAKVQLIGHLKVDSGIAFQS